MVDERILEALGHRVREVLELLLRQRQGRDDLAVDRLLHEAADAVVAHAVADDVEALEVCAEDKGRVRAVEDADLPLLVRRVVVDNENRQVDLVESELLRDRLRPFDDPEAEALSGVDHVVNVAVRPVDRVRLRARIAGHDAVDERRAERVGALDPRCEAGAEVPVRDVPQDALLELLAVMVDEFAREDDEALLGRAAEGDEALVEEARQLRGEARGRPVVVFARGIVGDARLGRVGREEAEVRIRRVREEGAEVDVGVDAAGDGRDDAPVVHLLSVLKTAQIERVKSLLPVDRVADEVAAGDRLHEADLAVEAGLLVETVKEVIDERAEEVALAELKDPLRRILQKIPVVTLAFKFGIAESVHVFLCHILSFILFPAL